MTSRNAGSGETSPALFSDDLPFYLAGLYHGFKGLIQRLRLDSGLHQNAVNPGMGSIFFALCQEDNCIIKRLVEKLKLPNATLTGLLDRMEATGIVERYPCPDDGRAFRVRLTPFGRSLESDMARRHRLAMNVLQTGLNDAEVSELKRLLSRVLSNLHADEARSRAEEKAGRAKVRAEKFARDRRKIRGRKRTATK